MTCTPCRRNAARALEMRVRALKAIHDSIISCMPALPPSYQSKFRETLSEISVDVEELEAKISKILDPGIE